MRLGFANIYSLLDLNLSKHKLQLREEVVLCFVVRTKAQTHACLSSAENKENYSIGNNNGTGSQAYTSWVTWEINTLLEMTQRKGRERQTKEMKGKEGRREGRRDKGKKGEKGGRESICFRGFLPLVLAQSPTIRDR